MISSVAGCSAPRSSQESDIGGAGLEHDLPDVLGLLRVEEEEAVSQATASAPASMVRMEADPDSAMASDDLLGALGVAERSVGDAACPHLLRQVVKGVIDDLSDADYQQLRENTSKLLGSLSHASQVGSITFMLGALSRNPQQANRPILFGSLGVSPSQNRRAIPL